MIDTLNISVRKVAESRINEVDFAHIPFGRVFADHMFVADYKDGEWTNLEVRPFEKLHLSPAVSALHYGQSIFEGLKANKLESGEIGVFRPQANWARLNRSAYRMCMPEVPEEVFMGGLSELLRTDSAWVPTHPGTSLYIRPFMFATDEYVGIRPSDTYKFIIFTCPVGAYYAEPVRVKIETEYARAVAGGTGAAKAAGNYAGALFPARAAQAKGFHQLIWTDALTHEYIEESGTMNVMFRINDTLITAPTTDTILAGITRDSVLTLARAWGYKVEERKVRVQEIVEALKSGTLKEAFGMGTAATIAQIIQVGYKDEVYDLPAVEGREFSNRVFQALNDIKAGRQADEHGWVYTI